MEVLALLMSATSLAGLAVATLLLKSFLPSYMAEKGKNAASREDLAHLTDLVERVKAQHGADMERLKAELLTAGQVAERRRKVYEEMCASLRIFVQGHGVTAEAKNCFHSTYAAAWLWASDAVLVALNKFIALQVQRAAGPGSVDQHALTLAYTDVVLAMRKDAGFADTSISAASYQFVYFGEGDASNGRGREV